MFELVVFFTITQFSVTYSPFPTRVECESTLQVLHVEMIQDLREMGKKTPFLMYCQPAEGFTVTPKLKGYPA